jgi:acyl-CoA thioester hydrolase
MPSLSVRGARIARVETRIQVRWPDFDALGHLNHAVYHVYLDEGRDAALGATVGSFDDWPNVLAHVSIDYRTEIVRGVREIVVRTHIVDVGRSSVRMRQEVLGPDGSTAAEAESVVVAWDPDARRSRTIGDEERAALLRLRRD